MISNKTQRGRNVMYARQHLFIAGACCLGRYLSRLVSYMKICIFSTSSPSLHSQKSETATDAKRNGHFIISALEHCIHLARLVSNGVLVDKRHLRSEQQLYIQVFG
jgi:hypothetical protein